MKISQNEIPRILQARLDEIKKTNPLFSMRGFAQKLDVNSGVLSQILSGKRNVSESFALKLADTLELAGNDRKLFFKSFEFEKKIKEVINSTEVSEDVLQKMTSWYLLGILNLVKLDNFTLTPEQASTRLGITITEAQEAIEFLLKQGLLAYNENEKIIRTEKRYKTSDNITHECLKKIQENNLKMGIDSIYRDEVEKRDFTAMTVAIDPENINQAKELIRKFQNDLALLLEHGEKKEVYKLVVGLFPLTRSE